MWPRNPRGCTNPLEGLNVLLWRKSWISGTRIVELMLTTAISLPLWKSKVYSPECLLHLGIPWILMSVWLSGSEQSWSCLQCPSEKAMAPHSSTLAWKIPWTEEPGRLQSMGSLRVRHDWATSLSPFTFMHWRRKGQPILVFLPGESQGWLSLVGCCLWGRTESDTTEAT